jgi:hypothetical protein
MSHFLTEIQELGWISYRANLDTHEEGKPFRLILPGIPAERGRMDDVAWIEFADKAHAGTIAGSVLVESAIRRTFDDQPAYSYCSEEILDDGEPRDME